MFVLVTRYRKRGTIPEFSNDEIDSLALTYGYLIVLPSWKQWHRICGNASDYKSAAERSGRTMKRRMVAH